MSVDQLIFILTWCSAHVDCVWLLLGIISDRGGKEGW